MCVEAPAACDYSRPASYHCCQCHRLHSLPERDLKAELELLLSRQGTGPSSLPSTQQAAGIAAPSSSPARPSLNLPTPQLPSAADVLHTAQSSWRTASSLFSQLQQAANQPGEALE